MKTAMTKLSVRITVAEQRLLKQRAKRAGLTQSEIIRRFINGEEIERCGGLLITGADMYRDLDARLSDKRPRIRGTR